MTATLAGYAGLAFATGQYLRPHYEAPLITSDPNVGTPALLISQWWTRGDTPVSMSALNQALQRDGAQEISPGRFQTNGLTQNSVDPVQYLTQHGFTQW